MHEGEHGRHGDRGRCRRPAEEVAGVDGGGRGGDISEGGWG